MKYLPLILLLLFGCKKKSQDSVNPPASGTPIVIPPVDTLTRKMSTVVFTYSTHCTGYEMYLNIKTSETGDSPYTFTTSIESKSSGTYTLNTDRRYITYNCAAYDKPLLSGQSIPCKMDLKITINGALYTSTTAYTYADRIKMYQNW